MDIRARLQTFFASHLASFDSGRPLHEQLSSLEIYTVISKLELEFGVHIHSLEMTRDRFKNLDTVTELVEQKLRAKPL